MRRESLGDLYIHHKKLSKAQRAKKGGTEGGITQRLSCTLREARRRSGLVQRGIAPNYHHKGANKAARISWEKEGVSVFIMSANVPG